MSLQDFGSHTQIIWIELRTYAKKLKKSDSRKAMEIFLMQNASLNQRFIQDEKVRTTEITTNWWPICTNIKNAKIYALKFRIVLSSPQFLK